MADAQDNAQNLPNFTRRYWLRALEAIGTFNSWGLPCRLAAAALIVLFGLGLRLMAFGASEHRFAYVTFYPAVAIAAAIGGKSGGIIATILSAAAVRWLMPFADDADWFGLAGFLASSAIIVGIAELLRVAQAHVADAELVRRHETQLAQFVEQAPAAMAMFDRDMRYLAVSGRWRDDYQLQRNIVGRSHYDVFPEIPEHWIQIQRRALAGETLQAEQEAFARADGSAQWLRWEARPWRHPSGDIGGIVIFSEDITQRVRSEAALRDQDRRLNAMFNTALEAIITIDKNGVIKMANPAARQMFGYDADEMPGRNVGMLMPDAHRERHHDYIATYLRTGKKAIIGRQRELQGLRKNGDLFPMELTVTEAWVNEEAQFVGFARDLSVIEAQKRRAEALERELLHVSRLSDMGEVAAGLAHEVSRPIQLMSIFIKSARRCLAAGEVPPVAEAVDNIERQAKSAAEILKRLRGFIEKRGSERAPENLRQLVEDSLELAQLRSRGRPAHVTLNLLEDEIMADVDRVQIQQVMVNLLRNAADAVADESKPQIVVATALVKPGHVEVSVSDNGPGVDPDVKERLFKPFITTKALGMGVGLSLCKTIINSHSGEIGFRDNDPRGAVFFFTLPTICNAGSTPDNAVISRPS